MADPISPRELGVSDISTAPPVGSAGVEVYSPKISVVLRKVIDRSATVAKDVPTNDRVSQAGSKEIDLTPFLARGTTVAVRRSVRGEDSGQFSINFPDDMHPDLMDSIYGLVEAQDVIEIRMARQPERGSAGDLPIVLRGFVSQVSRGRGISESGPSRSVVIAGQDYSKILNIIRFIYLPTMIPAQLLLSSFKNFLNYGVESNYESPAAFVRKIITEVCGEYIGKMRDGSGGSSSPVEDLLVEATDSDIAGSIQPFGVQEWDGGSIYSLLATFGDVGPWNELYVEDRDDGPTLVYRPTPFKTAVGDYIQGGARAAHVNLPARDILDIEVSRSDSNVANYFWVDAPRTNLLQGPLLQLDQQLAPSPALEGYQNADPLLYGVRLMRMQTQQGIRYDGKPEAEVEEGDGLLIELVNEKRRVLIENNKDNSVLETGSIVVKGSEALKPGSYVTVESGDFAPSYYAHTVDHQFTIGGAFLTTLSVERGTGFIERLKRGAANSAYLAEMTVGGVYG